ncbi:MAG TPA: sugar diacid recognition domain-containing protein [Pseudobacillus sp.]
MKFFEQIAQSIVEKTSAVLDVSMSITDAKGTIIGCSNVERLGSHHVVTEEVTKAGRSVSFTKENVAGRENVLPGVATPIRFQQQIIGVLGIIGEPNEVGRYVEFVRTHVEMMLQESFRTETFYLQMKTTELFIQHLIHFKEWDNESTLQNYCEMSGFHFDRTRMCILIDIAALHTLKKDKKAVRISQYDLFQIISNYLEDHSQDIISPINPGQWVVLKYIDNYDLSKVRRQCEQARKALKKFLQNNHAPSHVSIAYGKGYIGFAGVSRSYQQALQTLSTGKQNQKSLSGVYAFDDWTILLNTLIEEISPAFAETLVDYVEKLLSHPNAPVLVETFLVYCEEGLNVSKAARKLFVHRNTLLYRLNQLNEILSANTQSFEQSMLLYIALKQSKNMRQPAQVK